MAVSSLSALFDFKFYPYCAHSITSKEDRGDIPYSKYIEPGMFLPLHYFQTLKCLHIHNEISGIGHKPKPEINLCLYKPYMYILKLIL